VTSWFSTKVQLQMAPESGMSQAMADLEFKVRVSTTLSEGSQRLLAHRKSPTGLEALSSLALCRAQIGIHR
jgi:hypothetical protein